MRVGKRCWRGAEGEPEKGEVGVPGETDPERRGAARGARGEQGGAAGPQEGWGGPAREGASGRRAPAAGAAGRAALAPRGPCPSSPEGGARARPASWLRRGPCTRAGLCWRRRERDPEAAAAVVSAAGAGSRGVAWAAGPAGLGLRQVRRAQPARPPSAHGAGRARPRAGRWAPARRTCRTDGGDPWGPAPGPGLGQGLQDLTLAKRDWPLSHPYLDPRARVTARSEPGSSGTQTKRLRPCPTLFYLISRRARPDHPLHRKGLWPPPSSWPSRCRRVVLKAPVSRWHIA